MYIPAHFAESRPEEMHRILREHPLGMLVTHGADGLDADHIPFAFDAAVGPHGTLTAHVARSNSLWQRCPTGTPVMVVFRGAEAYISPNWYPSKHEAHQQVPTWNYRVVHVHGRLRVRDDERFVRGLVARLTRTHEAATQQSRPWKMTDSESSYIDRMLGAIVGIEIEIHRMLGKYKLSQNKEARDRQGAADALQALQQDALAEAIRKTL
jgi:transcriptional regulator